MINSADDERNPPESGIVERALARLPHGEYDLVPESSETRGHATLFAAKFYAARLAQFLASLPPGNARPGSGAARSSQRSAGVSVDAGFGR